MFISADYPYINYYVINKSREEAGHFYTHNKLASHDGLNAAKLGYTLVHSMDLYDEVGQSNIYYLAQQSCRAARNNIKSGRVPVRARVYILTRNPYFSYILNPESLSFLVTGGAKK